MPSASPGTRPRSAWPAPVTAATSATVPAPRQPALAGNSGRPAQPCGRIRHRHHVYGELRRAGAATGWRACGPAAGARAAAFAPPDHKVGRVARLGRVQHVGHQVAARRAYVYLAAQGGGQRQRTARGQRGARAAARAFHVQRHPGCVQRVGQALGLPHHRLGRVVGGRSAPARVPRRAPRRFHTPVRRRQSCTSLSTWAAARRSAISRSAVRLPARKKPSSARRAVSPR